MKETSDSSTLRDYLSVLSRRKRVIIATTLVALAVGLLYSVLREPTYEATATINFRDQAEQFAIFTPGLQTPVPAQFPPEKAAVADTRIVTRDSVVARVNRNLDTGMSDSELRDSVEATVEPDSNLVGITASAESSALAAQMADEFARQTRVAARASEQRRFERLAQQLEDTLQGGTLDSTSEAAYRRTIARVRTLIPVADPVEVVRPARAPANPSSPQPLRDTTIAALLGLIFGVGAAFLQQALDRRLKSPQQVQSDLGVPLLGQIREDLFRIGQVGRDGGGIALGDDLEAFRILRSNVDFLARDRVLSSLAVTSALPEEGKSTVASCYAYACAVGGRRTLLVECDFRRPSLAQRFGVENTPGLSDYLAGSPEPQDVLRAVKVSGPEARQTLALIPAGSPIGQPGEMVGSARFKEFVEQISRAYELVVFDSAPLLPVSDTLELLPQVDGVLLCVRLNQTTRPQARDAMQTLGRLSGRPVGLVVTGIEPGGEGDYYGYYSRTAASPDEQAAV